MKREIKFRAVREINGGFVYGSLIQKDGYSAIVLFDKESLHNEYLELEVNPETVGQFTGLLDKNGKEIYEGDILSDRWRALVYQNDEGTFMIKFHTGPKLNKPRSLKSYLEHRELAGTSDEDNIVIGNIYSNPELLK